MPLALALLLSGCVAAYAPSEHGVCDGVLPLANAHIGALLQPGVPDTVAITGEALISGLKDGCGWVLPPT